MSVSMHAVGKVRRNQPLAAGVGSGSGSGSRSGAHDFTVPPFTKPGWLAEHVSEQLQSYSSKMMKAIWGQYNRYSVHNLKSQQLPQQLEQPAAAAAPAAAAGGGSSAAIGAALINSN